MIIAECNLNQLIQLETILFSMEWPINPNIPPFSIICKDENCNEILKYKIIKTEDNVYRIVTD
jgi:hypothetical protein